jgi:hypothetical protein
MSKEIELIREKVAKNLLVWQEEQAATKVHREYLNSEGMYSKDNTKLKEILDERHRLALTAEDAEVRRKTINDIVVSAAGNPKITANIQNNQYNLGDFFNNVED